MATISSRKTISIAFFLWLSSWAVVQAGISYGRARIEPGAGLVQSRAVSGEDLFRFDSLFYHEVAEQGYAYNGDPKSAPNLVYAPLFPLLTRGFAAITMFDSVGAGFYFNRILFFFAIVFLLLYLTQLLGQARAAFAAFALVTAAGAYSFHAYDGEPAVFFFLSLALLSHSRRWWVMLALASGFLSAGGLGAGAAAAVFALMFLRQAWEQRQNRKALVQKLVLALVSVSGSLAYLSFVDRNFGNPLTLFSEIQTASANFFHPAASGEGGFATGEVRTLNLIWMALALISCVYMLGAWRKNISTYVFPAYFISVVAGGTRFDFLFGSHRVFVLVIPIFIMGTALHDWLARKVHPSAAIVTSILLLSLNVFYGGFMAAQFNQGISPYF